MSTQDDNIDKDELLDLLEEEDEEREPHTYKVWVHIEAIDEDGEPIEPDADLPTEICEVDTLDEATDVVAKLEAVDVFAKDTSKPSAEVKFIALADHIAAMADDAYLTGHPEWIEIVKEAQAAKAEGR